MKSFFFLQLLILNSFPLFSYGDINPPGRENVSFPMMNQEIRHTLKEHERQSEMHSNQTLNTVTEGHNNAQWQKLTTTRNKIQDRLSVISLAMQAIPASTAIVDASSRIKNYQTLIIQEIQTTPMALNVALPLQITFYDDLQMVVRFIIGIVGSYGVINQMEKAERKKLLDHALSEIQVLESDSVYTLMLIREYKDKASRRRGILHYIDKDKAIVKEILDNIKNY